MRREHLQSDPYWWGPRWDFLQLPEHVYNEWGWDRIVERIEGTHKGFEVRDRHGTLVARYTSTGWRNNWKES